VTYVDYDAPRTPLFVTAYVNLRSERKRGQVDAIIFITYYLLQLSIFILHVVLLPFLSYLYMYGEHIFLEKIKDKLDKLRILFLNIFKLVGD